MTSALKDVTFDVNNIGFTTTLKGIAGLFLQYRFISDF
jgi:hypothetical protein